MTTGEDHDEGPSDLGAFARPAAGSEAITRPRRLWPRLLAFGLVLGFLLLLGERAFDALRPTKSVAIVRPTPSATGASAAGIAAQVASFIEADPYPSVVTPLVAGVFDSIRVQSGDGVKAGDVLGTLDDREARLEATEAGADVLAKDAAIVAAKRRQAIAKDAFERAIDVEAELARARADLQGQQQNAAQRAAAIAGAEALRDVALAELERERDLEKSGTTGRQQVTIQAARLAAAEAAVAAAKAESALASALEDKAAVAFDQATKNLAARFELADRIAAADGAADEAAAGGAAATARRDLEALRLERTTLRAPIDGIVQTVLVRPGDPALPHSPAFVVFDPTRLRARADVPLASISRVHVKQKARVRPEGSSRTFAGEVSHVTAEADVQKVTLRVHVRLLEADGELVPERLCQVQLLEDQDPTKTQDARGQAVVLPRAALRPDGSILVVDRTGRRAERRTVTRGEDGEDSIVITSGVNSSDKVILTPGVEPGDRVTPEDSR